MNSIAIFTLERALTTRHHVLLSRNVRGDERRGETGRTEAYQGLDMNNEEGRRLEEIESTSVGSILAQEPRTFLRRS